MSWSAQQVAEVLRRPQSHDDKYRRGVLGLLTGSVEYPGAAALGAEAALQTGLGMVRYLGPARELVLARRPEVVCQSGTVSAALIGSGMPMVSVTDPSVQQFIAQGTPVIADAGALEPVLLTAFADGRSLILTPHAGEAARLLCRDRSEVEADPLAAATELSAASRATVVLKGTVTHIVSVTDNAGINSIAIGPSSPWLATAGTGDVLAGILGALLAGNPSANAAALAASAVWLHSEAAARLGGPLLASELASAVNPIVREVLG